MRAEVPSRRHVLVAAGYDDTNFRFVVEPEAFHTETAWAARLPGALEFLFGAWREETAPHP